MKVWVNIRNTGSANFIADYNAALTGETPASKLNPLLRTTIYFYPVLIYYKEKLEDTEQKFIGVWNLNLDKSCTNSYGLDGKVKNGKIKDLYKKIKLLQKKNATAFII